jgi:hypothetical protein
MAVLFASLPCDAKVIPRRDPLDGAIDATLIAIVKQQSPDTFRIEETFPGSASVGDILLLPGFRLAVEDTSVFIRGMESIEPIYNTTRILLFLKPAKSGTQPLGNRGIR